MRSGRRTAVPQVRQADSGSAENEKNGGREKANGKTEQKASAEAEELLETLREVPFPDPHDSAGTDRSMCRVWC